MRGFFNWIAERRQRQQLERKNLEAQLALLKAQINPHFLFNTLNNIDVLIEKDPQKASVYLQKLSGILRFMLYENTDEKIPLSKEVAYINEYIELQKIRTANPDFIQFTVQGNTGHTLVAPMLFIPFIENAFKHSTNKKIDKGISVAIKSDKDQIKFTCVNVYDEAAMQTQEHSGLGLELIQNRLDLLYPNQYRLDLDKTSDLFSVTLTININGN
ncbi:histidine kinase [Mucilaginibacter mali]|uniref:Histidine kinase n=1 Tax=Mucilaginibacter mali TaxID=2740462 RepID=A0A7D4U944_9SPHI|nr:histidine kinase [Mucilaginibacter mali]QKJ28738.1 histidine kinase [Mucilaginibacter mali]